MKFRGKKAPGKKFAGNGVAGVEDARNRIISKNRAHLRDARETLVKKAKTTDARSKLEKIRNLKNGKLDVKKTAKGGITITTTTAGKVLLTTAKRKTVKKASKPQPPKKKKVPAKPAQPSRPPPPHPPVSKSSSRSKEPPITRTIRGRMSESARLDYELLNTRVDPVILKRTVRQNVIRERSPVEPSRFYRPMSSRRSPEADFYESRARHNMLKSPLTTRSSRSMLSNVRPALERRERSRSPLNYGSSSYSSSRRPRYDFNDPRRDLDREEEIRRRRILKEEVNNRMYSSGRGLEDTVPNYISPLQGAKVMVSNLHNTVTQEDIIELFGDVGPLKRVKVSSPGAAEVVFINRDDAIKAVETYHNRQLDGKAMKCQLLGSNNSTGNYGEDSIALHHQSQRSPPAPEMGAVYQALFDNSK